MEVQRPVRPLPNEMTVLDRVVAVETVRSGQTPDIFKGRINRFRCGCESRMAPKAETKQWKDGTATD